MLLLFTVGFPSDLLVLFFCDLSTVPMLYEISEDQITILIEQTDSRHSALDKVTFVADVYNIIQIIEFE